MNWTDRLSEYLDGDLGRRETETVEARLAEDAGLRDLLQELRAVKSAAAERPILEAPAKLWDGVRERIEGEPVLAGSADGRRRMLRFTVPQLAAAAVALLLLGGGLTRVVDLAGPEGPAGEPIAAEERAVPAGDARFASVTGAAPAEYGMFVDDLEARLDAGRELLDPRTVRVLDESLATIDGAIRQARTALENDPNNRYLNQHLASVRARKLRLLEDATALVAART